MGDRIVVDISVDLTPDQMDRFMREAIAEARQGESEGEVPIGSVLVLGSGDEAQIVGRGHNRNNGLQRRNAHAEIVMMESTDGRIPEDAEELALFSTLEPCVMCFGAAMESGIPLVVFGCPAPLDSGPGRVKPPASPETKVPRVIGDILRTKCEALFRNWLERNRATGKPLQVQFVQATLGALKD